ncbi:MAG: hypothetical protein ABH871_09990 [Pseudomonadota bacterium]
MFKYDVLIEQDDICNYEAEIATLRRYASNKEKIILIAPRRYGKTSIAVNVIGKGFVSKKKTSIFCYANLQEVADLDSIAVRLAHALEDSVNQAFPVRSRISKAIDALKLLKPQVNIDPVSGEPAISLSLGKSPRKELNDIFDAIRSLADGHPLLLCLDELQDVAAIPEAEALLRAFLQTMAKSPVLISGSKRHLLANIFLDERKPLYNWGKIVELKPIAIDKWKEYILARFKTKKLSIADAALKTLLEGVFYIPNYVCKICSELYEIHTNCEISAADVGQAIHKIYLDTQSLYAEKISFLTRNQLKFLVLLAKEVYIKEITAKEIVGKCGLSTRGISQIAAVLLDKGYFEREEKGLRVADPFFANYLSREF